MRRDENGIDRPFWDRCARLGHLSRHARLSCVPDEPGWVPDGEAQSKFSHDVEDLEIHSRLGKPHSFGPTAKAMFKVANSPNDLSVFVAAIGKRQDHVIVGLRDG